MKIFLEGDKGTAVCHDCAALVKTTFLRRDVPFSDGSGAARIFWWACVIVAG